MPTSPTQLQYATATPRRRRWRRWLLFLLLLTTIAFSAKWGKPALSQAQYLYNQHRCMTDHLRPDQVVFDDDPAEAQKLIHANPEYKFAGADYQNRSATITSVAGRTSRALDELHIRVGSLSTTRGPAILFIHARRAPDHPERLVVLDCSEYVNYQRGITALSFRASVIALASVRLRSYAEAGFGGSGRALAHGHLQFFAGQPDPADPSHFTMRYEINSKPGLIDGWLTEKDDIRLTVRNGPLLNFNWDRASDP